MPGMLVYGDTGVQVVTRGAGGRVELRLIVSALWLVATVVRSTGSLLVHSPPRHQLSRPQDVPSRAGPALWKPEGVLLGKITR